MQMCGIVYTWQSEQGVLCGGRAGLSPDAVGGMVQAFRRATKIKLHANYLAGPSAAAAIAAGSRRRGEQGLPVDALDMSQCRRATELHAQQFFDAIPTLQ